MEHFHSDHTKERVQLNAFTSGGTCGDGTLDGGESCDTGAANGTASSCCTNSCTFVAAATVCRASAGICETAETCTGASGTCPTDAFQPSSQECRASGGVCDVAESCTAAAQPCADRRRDDRRSDTRCACLATARRWGCCRDNRNRDVRSSASRTALLPASVHADAAVWASGFAIVLVGGGWPGIANNACAQAGPGAERYEVTITVPKRPGSEAVDANGANAAVAAPAPTNLPLRSMQVGAFREQARATALRDTLAASFEDVSVLEVLSGGQSIYRVNVGRLARGPGLDALRRRLIDGGYPAFEVTLADVPATH